MGLQLRPNTPLFIYILYHKYLSSQTKPNNSNHNHSMPQVNGGVESGFVILSSREREMMAAAGFTKEIKHQLWTKCFSLATQLNNFMPITVKGKRLFC